MHETEAINEDVLLYIHSKCIEKKKERERKRERERERERTRVSFKTAYYLASEGRRPSKCILSSSPFRHPRLKGVTLSMNECTITKQRGERHEYGPIRV